MRIHPAALLTLSLLSACSCEKDPTGLGDAGGALPDLGVADSGRAPDGGQPDSGRPDQGVPDGGGGGGPDAGACTSGPETDPNCFACRCDGASCSFSINCQSGSICNDPSEPLFDPTQPTGVCIRVICASPAECDPGETCTLDGVCAPSVCLSSAECAPGELCVAGRCQPPPAASEVASCTVVPFTVPMIAGTRLALEAVARRADGTVVSQAPVSWQSSDAAVVAVMGAEALAIAAGDASVNALVAGGPVCSGVLQLHVLEPLGSDQLRVVVVRERTGAPLSGASVTVQLAGGLSAGSTDVRGVALFNTGELPASVTAGLGRSVVSLMAPASRDLVLALPSQEPAATTGARGSLDLRSQTRRDLNAGFAAFALRPDLRDMGLGRGQCQTTQVLLNAPELGLFDEAAVAESVIFGLSNRDFTAVAERCAGAPSSIDQPGCFLARSDQAGLNALWALGGRLRLADITLLANQLGGLPSMCGPPGADGVMGLATVTTPRFSSGLDPAFEAPALAPNVVRPGEVGACNDPARADYDLHCGPSYQQFAEAQVAVTQPLERVSLVRLPVGSGGACPEAMLLMYAVELPGRGLIPLGMSRASGQVGPGGGCELTQQVVGGPGQGISRAPQEMVLRAAAPHDGAEDHPLLLVAASFASGGFGNNDGPQPLSLLVQRGATLPDHQTLPGTFLALPAVHVGTANRQVSLDQQIPAATLVRVEVLSAGVRHLIYAPSISTSFAIPEVAGLTAALASTAEVRFSAARTAVSFERLFSTGSGETLQENAGQTQSSSTRRCLAPPSPCTLE